MIWFFNIFLNLSCLHRKNGFVKNLVRYGLENNCVGSLK